MKKAKKITLTLVILLLVIANLLLVWNSLYYREIGAVEPAISSWQSTRDSIETAIFKITQYLEGGYENRQELLSSLNGTVGACKSYFQSLQRTAGQFVYAERKYGFSKNFPDYTSSIWLEIDSDLYILSVALHEFHDTDNIQEEPFQAYLLKIRLVLDGWRNHFDSYDFSVCKTPKESCVLIRQ